LAIYLPATAAEGQPKCSTARERVVVCDLSIGEVKITATEQRSVTQRIEIHAPLAGMMLAAMRSRPPFVTVVATLATFTPYAREADRIALIEKLIVNALAKTRAPEIKLGNYTWSSETIADQLVVVGNLYEL
jgi:hypothetical protein